MPNRMIRDSCRTSATLDTLSPEAERLFWRLVTVADDYGRFEADPRVLLAQAFPLKVGTWKPAQVARWFDELVQAGILHPYQAGGKALAAFVTWDKHQRVRAKQSKFAPPDTFAHMSESAVLSDDSTCQQTTADVAVVVVEDEDVTPPTPSHGSGGFEEFWLLYPRKTGKLDAERAWRQTRGRRPPLPTVLEAVRRQAASPGWRKDGGQYVPTPGKWLRHGCWTDEASRPPPVPHPLPLARSLADSVPR